MAVRLAGMNVTFLPSAFWPFSGLIDRLSRKANPFLIEAGWDEATRHKAVRDDLVRSIRAVPGGAVISPVRSGSFANSSQPVDFVARTPARSTASGRVLFSIKIGDASPLQRVLSPPALTGLSIEPVAADVIFVDVQPPDWTYQFAMVLAS